jgi:predicted AlkP superfamily phosphohydrolase/phosphomutase
MISGVAIPRGANFVHPREWAAELERRAPFPINGMEWMSHRSDPRALIDEALIIVEQRTAAYEVLLEGKWDVAACVYVAPDRLQHALGAYLLPTHPDHAGLSETPIAEALRRVFRTLDEALDRLMRKSGPETTTILMSDHGFRPITRIANLRRLLFAIGSASPATGVRVSRSLRHSRAARVLLGTKAGTALRRRIRSPATVDWGSSIAYPSALGGGVSINLKGREPNGVVDPRDFERARREVAAALLAYRDPETGEHPAAAVVMKEELPSGPYLDLAPDLFVRPEALWSFGKIDGVTSPTNWPTGSHRRSGILAASGPGISRVDLVDRDLVDLAATILSPYGLVPQDLDGKAIEEISGPARESIADAAEPSPTGRQRMTEREEDEVARHLRELGYIE